MIIREVNPYVEEMVNQAMEQRFIIDLCIRCHGPRVHSRIKPIAKCFNCGAAEEFTVVKASEQRIRCDTCKKFFWSTVKWRNCGRCKAQKDRAKAIEAKWSGSSKKDQ